MKEDKGKPEKKEHKLKEKLAKYLERKDKKEKHEEIEKHKVKEKMKKLHKKDKEIQALDKHLKKKGFVPAEKDEAFVGHLNTVEVEDSMVFSSLNIQAYDKPDADEHAAIGQAVLTVDDRSEVYSFVIESDKRDYKAAKEYKVDKEFKVVETNSYWSCILAVMEHLETAENFGELIRKSLKACGTSEYYWACMIAYIAIYYASKFIIANGACLCNCGWWCVWLWDCWRM